MTSFPATGRWVICSVQKTLPVIGRIGAIFGTHNYLALIDPDGAIDSEMHGVYTDRFTVNGPVASNYLHVRMYREHGYMESQSVLDVKPVFSGDEEDLRRLLHTGYREVAKSLDRTRMLYDGAEIIGHAVNSNSVWYTALRAMGVEDPSQFDGWGATPGNGVDLREEPSNNKWFAKPDDRWISNPAFVSLFPEALYLPPTSEVLAPEPFDPPIGDVKTDIEDEQEQLSRRLQDIQAIISAIDDDAFPADRDVVEGFLDDLDAQLGALATLSGTDLLDRLQDLVNRLTEWRDYLQDRSEAEEYPDALSATYAGDEEELAVLACQEDDVEFEEETQPLVFKQEDEPEPDYFHDDPEPSFRDDDDRG